MNNLFREDGKWMRALRAGCDIVLFNLLWLVCSLPLVTIGASSAALYDCLIARARSEASGARVFFRAFSARFRRASALWLIVALAALVLVADYRFSLTLPPVFRFLCLAVYVALLVLLLITLPFLFLPPALGAKSIPQSLQTAFLWGITHLPRTLAVLMLWLIPPLWLVLSPGSFLRIGWVWIGFGFGLIAFLSVKLVQKPLQIDA